MFEIHYCEDCRGKAPVKSFIDQLDVKIERAKKNRNAWRETHDEL